MSWSRGYTYSFPGEERSRTRVTTSGSEVAQILVAFVVMTVDLLLIFGDVNFLDGFDTSFLSQYLLPLVGVSAGAAFTGFVCHEMAHKVSAQNRGFWAEFRASTTGLFVSVVTALLGFLWAAPGATVVGGVPAYDREDWGRIALAGPLMNIAFALVFYVASIGLFLAFSLSYFWFLVLSFTNAWFGTFNMIPLGPLDGRKVLQWSTGVWLAAFLGIAAFTALAAVALYVYGDPLLI